MVSGRIWVLPLGAFCPAGTASVFLSVNGLQSRTHGPGEIGMGAGTQEPAQCHLVAKGGSGLFVNILHKSEFLFLSIPFSNLSDNFLSLEKKKKSMFYASPVTLITYL